MRKIAFILLCIIGFTLLSCQSKLDLKSDKQLTEIFTDSELKDIEKMISYVDDMVVEETGNRDINEAYHQLLDKMDESMKTVGLFVPFEEEEKYQFFESLDSTFFNEIWYMGNRLRYAKYKDSTYHDLDNYKYLGLRISGKYVDYLEKIGEEDKNICYFKEDIKLAGGISPAAVARFLYKRKDFDFTIPKHRLWVTVFILSIEEPHDKKMERYLNQKESS